MLRNKRLRKEPTCAPYLLPYSPPSQCCVSCSLPCLVRLLPGRRYRPPTRPPPSPAQAIAASPPHRDRPMVSRLDPRRRPTRPAPPTTVSRPQHRALPTLHRADLQPHRTRPVLTTTVFRGPRRAPPMRLVLLSNPPDPITEPGFGTIRSCPLRGDGSVVIS